MPTPTQTKAGERTIPRVEFVNTWWRVVLKDDREGYTTVAPFDSEEAATQWLASDRELRRSNEAMSRNIDALKARIASFYD